MKRKPFWIASGLAVALATGLLAHRFGCLSGPSKAPVVMAVVSSEISAASLENAIKVGCADCQVIQSRIAKKVPQITPQDLSDALNFGLKSEMTAVLIPFALESTSAELDAAFKKMKSSRAVLVVAAGTGSANPFHSISLEKVYPQSRQDAVVVGSARALDDPDYLMNSGDALDLIVVGQRDSAQAAALVAGYVAKHVSVHPEHDAASVRALLRATATQSKLSSGMGRVADFARIGFGDFNAKEFLSAAIKPLAYQRFINAEGDVDLELSSNREITSIEGGVKCKDGSESQQFKAPAVTILKKGRARVSIVHLRVDRAVAENLSDECRAKLEVKFEMSPNEGASEQIELDLRAWR